MPDKWWVISESELEKALAKCYEGDLPQVVLIELLANSETEKYDA